MTLSPLLSRALALSLLGACFWLVYVAVILPLSSQMSNDFDRIGQAQLTMARARQLESGLSDLQKKFDQLSAVPRQNIFRSGATPMAIAAEMNAAVIGMASTSGVILRNSRSLPISNEEGRGRIEAEFELLASHDSLAAFLYALEMSMPMIAVDRLTCQISENGGATRNVGEDKINVTVRLVSFTEKQILATGVN